MKTTQTHSDTDTHKRAQPLPEPLSAEAYQAERISPTLRLLDLALQTAEDRLEAAIRQADANMEAMSDPAK